MSGTAAARYGALSAARTTVLQRAREASRLTIPGLIPDDGQNEHTVFEQPFQSLGARCVSSLSATLLLALFPPNLPFFRLNMDEDTAKQLGTQLGEANARLAVLARAAYSLMSGASLRPILMEVLRHLIVAGNCLLYLGQDRVRFFRLDQYVVKRDGSGRWVEIVVVEKVYPSTLPEEAQVILGKPTEGGQEEMVEMYTVIRREGDRVEQYQEIKGTEVPGSRGSSPADAAAWIPLRWLVVPGSDYGRAHVTENIGDLMSLEDLSKAMVQFAMAASRIIHIVDPNSGVDVEELADAPTGEYVTGYIDRIKTLQLEKGQDWAVMNQLAERLEQRIAAAFLLRSGVMRDAERVTAEEVRIVAQELENALGGTYTVLSDELQMPLVRRYLYLGTRNGRIPKLPKAIQPVIVTGFDALGRAHSVNRIRAWAQDSKAVIGEAEFNRRVNGTELLQRMGEGHGVEGLEDLLKSDEQLASEQQEQALAEVGAAAAPTLAKAGVEAAVAQAQEPE
ncbi:MAG: portal protein [Phenylobacterium sp.]|uniref:portal protein n=1 Tax=Phenylobacterium sp. TaxID=1871053 RepID=UPI00391D721F